MSVCVCETMSSMHLCFSKPTSSNKTAASDHSVPKKLGCQPQHYGCGLHFCLPRLAPSCSRNPGKGETNPRAGVFYQERMVFVFSKENISINKWHIA